MSNTNIVPPVSFYSLQDRMINGQAFDFSALQGKKVLLVNTASDCGYTNQYEDLEKLYRQQKDKLVILGFPANDFKEQEKGSDAEIEQFCKVNYGVTFPLMKKSTVVKGAEQNDVYNWLADPSKNGWNQQQPTWNFAKYLWDEEGKLTDYFDPALPPMDKSILDALNR